MELKAIQLDLLESERKCEYIKTILALNEQNINLQKQLDETKAEKEV